MTCSFLSKFSVVHGVGTVAKLSNALLLKEKINKTYFFIHQTTRFTASFGDLGWEKKRRKWDSNWDRQTIVEQFESSLRGLEFFTF